MRGLIAMLAAFVLYSKIGFSAESIPYIASVVLLQALASYGGKLKEAK